MEYTFCVKESGERLDRWLTSQLPTQSRNSLQRWIRAGHVRVDGNVARASLRLEADQTVTVSAPEPAANPTVQAEAIPLDIRYEDDDILVVNKAAGMVVHPAPGNWSGTMVNALLHLRPDMEGVGAEHRPGIVHRLDKETSGLLVVAKNEIAHRQLQAQFKARTVYKEYSALVDGWIEPPAGRIDAPIGRHPTARKRMAVLLPHPVTGAPRGRDARTDYETVARYFSVAPTNENRTRFSLLRIIIHSGRTHQIRVHLAWHNFPICGDTLYGYSRPRLRLPRQFLHAGRLRFMLPGTQHEREFDAPLPDDLRSPLDALSEIV